MHVKNRKVSPPSSLKWFCSFQKLLCLVIKQNLVLNLQQVTVLLSTDQNMQPSFKISLAVNSILTDEHNKTNNKK